MEHAGRTLDEMQSVCQRIANLRHVANATLHGNAYLDCTRHLDMAASYLVTFLASTDTAYCGVASGEWIKLEYMVSLAASDIDNAIEAVAVAFG